ncbi:hypothetical protein [Vibrio algivorus]|uniref:Uncharacterized protein n=1 Tax=Vibrio algivorus TaxID=1667024 RepID=A0A557PGV5_9VIBR|nr:hypothetical protein [Vibrio algivorus]TVO39897.1 hypothetical protein FOF44_00050 [Vibrio algivorus]
MQNTNDPWVCIDDDESDYIVEHFEVRVKGQKRKPLIIKAPTMSKLLFLTRQYLNTSDHVVRNILRVTIIDTPDPITAAEHFRIIEALEHHLAQRA